MFSNKIAFKSSTYLLILFSALVVLSVSFSPRLRSWIPVLVTIIVGEPSIDEDVKGAPLVRGISGDVVLLVDNDRIANSAKDGAFATTHWSYAWNNVLSQGWGGAISIVDRRDVISGIFEGCRLVVVSSSVARYSLDDELKSILESFVRSGGCLLLERPSRDWRYFSGGTLEDKPLNSALGSSRGLLLKYSDLPYSLNDRTRILEDLPFCSFVHSTESLEQGTEPLGRVRDVPALWWRRWNAGTVISLTFDMGLQIQAMQQGMPYWKSKVGEVNGIIPGLVESQDLSIARDMRANEIPYADILEDWLADICAEAVGDMPRWWRFPYACDGILSVTHDDEELGPKAFSELWELEQSEQVRSTIFHICLNGDEGDAWREYEHPYTVRGEYAWMDDSPANLAIHWYRFWPGIPLIEQAKYGIFGHKGAKFSRIHFLDWGRDYAAPFRRLAKAGVNMDSSYGPNRGRGYVFGTGLPFQIVDDNGFPLNIWEYPFETQENWFGVDSAFIDGLIHKSSSDYHQALAVLLHPHRWISEPAGREYLRHIVKTARSERHWIANLSDYWNFMKLRSKAQARSRWDGDALWAELYVPSEGLGLLLSSRAFDVKIDGKTAETRSIRINGEERILVAVPRGAKNLSASYR